MIVPKSPRAFTASHGLLWNLRVSVGLADSSRKDQSACASLTLRFMINSPGSHSSGPGTCPKRSVNWMLNDSPPASFSKPLRGSHSPMQPPPSPCPTAAGSLLRPYYGFLLWSSHRPGTEEEGLARGERARPGRWRWQASNEWLSAWSIRWGRWYSPYFVAEQYVCLGDWRRRESPRSKDALDRQWERWGLNHSQFVSGHVREKMEVSWWRPGMVTIDFLLVNGLHQSSVLVWTFPIGPGRRWWERVRDVGGRRDGAGQ